MFEKKKQDPLRGRIRQDAQDAGRPCNPKIILHILPTLSILLILFSL